MITGYLEIYNNTNIVGVEGLHSLISVGGYLQIDNNINLASVEGLRSLTSVGEYLRLINNANLASVEGLRSLVSVGGWLSIWSNTNLVSVEGLRSLKSIRGTGQNGHAIYLYSNPALARGLPFPALTCKAGPAWPGDATYPNNAYVTANIPAINNVSTC
jgi:hypothetical protein